MEQLTQTISNLVGILLGVVGAVGVGFFIYGAYLYLTASGAPHQMERGKSAMMTALAGIVLALVAYGVVELVMNAVVDPGIEHRRRPARTRSAGRRQRRTADRPREEGERDMREHEVPTHVQAEDKVLLGFTFPQIVAVTAVCAISYGAYRYAPVGPSEVRMALAVVLGLVGVAMVVGKIGGRRLPLVAADLLKYRLGAQASTPGRSSQLVRDRDPGSAPVQPGEERPRPPEPDGETQVEARAGKAAQEQEDPQEQRTPQRADALPSPQLVRQAQGKRREDTSGRPGPPGRDPGDQRNRKPQKRHVSRPCGPGRPDGRCRGASRSRPWPTTTSPGGTRSTSRSPSLSPDGGYSSRRCHRLRRPRCRHIAVPPPPWTSGCGPSAGRRAHWLRFWGSATPRRGGAHRLLAPPPRTQCRPSPCPGRTALGTGRGASPSRKQQLPVSPFQS